MMGKKTILIIGGHGLLGKEIVKNLIIKGFEVIILDKKREKLFKKVDFFRVDVTKIHSLNKAFKKIYKKYQKIDVVVNCSYPKNRNWGSKFEKLKSSDLKENLYLQIGSAIIVAQVSLGYFLKQKFGNLIMISSILGISAPKFNHYKNTKMTTPIEYSAAKAGIISVTRYLAKYYGNKNIRVNCVSPGGIKDRQPKIFAKKYKNSCLSKGLLDPEDIFGTVEFLISEKSRYINGQNIIIDDGWSL
jgi:NAD(P)-dependent dehydrogenase (short-subunit alcohol dehydrogenase family)